MSQLNQSQLNQYVGLDVSLKETSISVIDEADKTIWRGRSMSTPDDIAEKVQARAPHAVRIGLECGQLSNWLYHGLTSKGLPVICIDARHAHATLSLRINKTDANDAQGLAQLMRVGWYRETTVKGLDCRYVRSMLVVRQRLVFQITAQKNCVRGVIKGFGRVMPKALKRTFVPKIRAAIADDPMLAALIEPALRSLEAAMEQLLVYDRAVLKQARGDETVRLLNPRPRRERCNRQRLAIADGRTRTDGGAFRSNPTSLPSCSVPSRCGLEAPEIVARFKRRPILTAPARASRSETWLGRKKACGAVEQKSLLAVLSGFAPRFGVCPWSFLP